MTSLLAKTAYVFKTMVDPFIGKYSFIKVCSGVLKGDDVHVQCIFRDGREAW